MLRGGFRGREFVTHSLSWRHGREPIFANRKRTCRLVKSKSGFAGQITIWILRIMKRFRTLFLVIVPVSLITLGFVTLQTIMASRNGGVCNESSQIVWLTLTESGRQKAYSLPPGYCTHVFTQDAEAIWGRVCDTNPCRYQAWKVGAGHFEVADHGDSSVGSILVIRGWGAGSRWRMAPTCPRPDLTSITYSLIR